MYCKNCGMKLGLSSAADVECQSIMRFLNEKILDYMERTIIKKRGSL